jgi:hypothetical protein
MNKVLTSFLSLILFTVILLGDGKTGAQELDDIITDRPDQTESAVTVPKGTVQIELGGTYESDKIDNSNSLLMPSFRIKTISAPSVLVRWGILKNVELRLAAEHISEKITPLVIGGVDEEQSGLSPVTIGTKIQLFTEKGSRPDAAFLFHLNIPFKKNDPFQPEYIGTDFRVAVAHTLSERFSLSYNLGGEWNGNTPEATGVYTLALGAGLDQRLSAFVELYGFLPQGSEPDHRFDGGLTYLIAKNIQADVSAGIGISEISPDIFIALGISVRLPK